MNIGTAPQLTKEQTARIYARMAFLITMTEAKRNALRLDLEGIDEQIENHKKEKGESHRDKQQLGYIVIRKKELECAIYKLDLEIEDYHLTHKNYGEDLKAFEEKKDDVVVPFNPMKHPEG